MEGSFHTIDQLYQVVPSGIHYRNTTSTLHTHLFCQLVIYEGSIFSGDILGKTLRLNPGKELLSWSYCRPRVYHILYPLRHTSRNGSNTPRTIVSVSPLFFYLRVNRNEECLLIGCVSTAVVILRPGSSGINEMNCILLNSLPTNRSRGLFFDSMA